MAPGGSPEALVANRELGRAVARAVRALPADEATAAEHNVPVVRLGTVVADRFAINSVVESTTGAIAGRYNTALERAMAGPAT